MDIPINEMIWAPMPLIAGIVVIFVSAIGLSIWELNND